MFKNSRPLNFGQHRKKLVFLLTAIPGIVGTYNCEEFAFSQSFLRFCRCPIRFTKRCFAPIAHVFTALITFYPFVTGRSANPIFAAECALVFFIV